MKKSLIIPALVMMAFITVLACAKSGNPMFQSVTAKQFHDQIAAEEDPYILDVRRPAEFAEGHMEGARNLDWLNQDAFLEGVPSIPKDRTVYVYCRSGGRSAQAATYLAKQGYKVVDLAGGILAWRQMEQ